MVQEKHFRLITLGRLALLSAEDEATRLSKQRRKLALLAVLAVSGSGTARRPVSRDTLIEMFWGDQDEARARHSLSEALSHLRRVFGRTAVATRQATVELSEELPLVVDAVELATAHAARDVGRVLELYEGPFLEAVHVSGAPSFDHWADRERARLQPMFLQACEQQCLALARGRRWDSCAAVGARWLDAEPLSSDAALYVLNATKASGTRVADRRALEAYDALRTRLARDFALAPDPAVVELAASIAARLSSTGAEVATTASMPAHDAPGAATPAPPPPSMPATADRPRRSSRPSLPRGEAARSGRDAGPGTQPLTSRTRWRVAAGVVAAAVTVSVLVLAAGRVETRAAATRAPPMIAVLDIHWEDGDTSAAWMGRGIAHMIAAKLSRNAAVDVVTPERVREVKERAELQTRPRLTEAELMDLGRRLGATWVLSGGLTRGDTAMVLDLTIHDVARHERMRLFAVPGANALAVADAAAARVLDAAGASGSGPQLAEVETASLKAYEHYARYLQAAAEGRMSEAVRELNAAVALDSGFITAVRIRWVLARSANDAATRYRLDTIFDRFAYRATEWDRLQRRIEEAHDLGRLDRAEALARQLVGRYPGDPRAYWSLASQYASNGRWREAEGVFTTMLAIDSLALEAGRGACAACSALFGLAGAARAQGDLRAAERATRRLVALQPEWPGSWGALGRELALQGKYDEALSAFRRALILSADEPGIRHAWVETLIMMRRFEAADSALAILAADTSEPLRRSAFDLSMMLARERGRFREATRIYDVGRRAIPELEALGLVRANNLARIGDHEGAAREYERMTHIPAGAVDVTRLIGGAARAFAWHHALLADAIAPLGDTVRLRALADSIERIGTRSGYGRDWRLHHHVRGLIAARGERYEEAVREFEHARYGIAGWTRTLAEKARAEMALGRPADAIATLQNAYVTNLDAMGRYLPRSEVDYYMVLAFRQARMPDSAAVYETYVRRAWRDADPEVKRMLARLDHAPNAILANRSASATESPGREP